MSVDDGVQKLLRDLRTCLACSVNSEAISDKLRKRFLTEYTEYNSYVVTSGTNLGCRPMY